jgi:CspA family cold shock protein
MPQCQGSVRWFNNARGFGFLAREGGADVFCHFSAIQGGGYLFLKEGERVSYDVVVGAAGRLQAHNVVRAGGMVEG